MEKINVGLTDDQRTQVVRGLNTLLADEHVLYVKTRNYHWNVVGPRFHSLHEFFEDVYEQLAEVIDEVAENARQFGGFASGTMTEFLQIARLKEQPGRIPDQTDMLRDLLNDHEQIIRSLREDIDKADDLNAPDAADFLTAVLEKHNKIAWMTRSLLPDIERSCQPDVGAANAGNGKNRQ